MSSINHIDFTKAYLGKTRDAALNKTSEKNIEISTEDMWINDVLGGNTTKQPSLETFNRDIKRLEADDPSGQSSMMYCGLALLASSTALVNLGASTPASPLFPAMAGAIGKALISPDAEKQIGKEIDSYFESQVGFSDDPAMNKRLNDIGNEIIKQSNLPDGKYDFKILDMDNPNAHTAPGKIYMTRGMMELLDKDSHLAFFVGHEVAHMEDRDSMENLGEKAFRNTIKQGTFMLRDASLGEKTVGEARKELMEMYTDASKNYGWENELTADRRGAELMIKAGYKAEEAVEALEISNKKVEEMGYKWNPETSAHPEISKRIEVVSELI